MKRILILFLFFYPSQGIAQDYASIHNGNILLDNGIISRKIVHQNDSLYSLSLSLKSDTEKLYSKK